MEITFQQYESIQDYLDDKMSPEKRADFERQVETDSLLKEYLVFEQELRQDLESIEENKETQPYETQWPQNSDNKFDDPKYIRSLINRAGAEDDKESIRNSKEEGGGKIISLGHSSLTGKDKNISDSPSRVISTSYSTGLAVAASLIILVICAIWLFAPSPSSTGIVHNNNNDTPAIQQNIPEIIKRGPDNDNLASLFKKFFTKDKVPAEKPEYLASALDDYERGKYLSMQNQDLANIPGYRGSFVNSKQNVRELGHYYKGLAFIETNKNSDAIKNLQWVIDSAANQQLVAKAQWYLALTYLQEKDLNKARTLLDIVAKDARVAPFNGNAEKLLGELKQ